MKKKYESMIIIRPKEEEEIENTLTEIKKFITDKDGEIEELQEWGTQKLAYKIDNLSEGYYAIIYFKSDPKNIKEVKNFYKLHDNIIRYIIINTDKK